MSGRFSVCDQGVRLLAIQHARYPENDRAKVVPFCEGTSRSEVGPSPLNQKASELALRGRCLNRFPLAPPLWGLFALCQVPLWSCLGARDERATTRGAPPPSAVCWCASRPTGVSG